MINDFGGKPAVEFEGRAMFAELAIALTAIRAGWSARWVEVYYLDKGKPYYLLDWNDSKPFKQKSVPPDSSSVIELMESIEKFCVLRHAGAEKRRNPFAGAWDVLMWRGERTILIESKRKGKDAINGNQVKWYSGAIDAGMKRDNFLVVQWQFEDDKISGRRAKSLVKGGASITSVPKDVSLLQY
jgi:hypothetical protein